MNSGFPRCAFWPAGVRPARRCRTLGVRILPVGRLTGWRGYEAEKARQGCGDLRGRGRPGTRHKPRRQIETSPRAGYEQAMNAPPNIDPAAAQSIDDVLHWLINDTSDH